DRLLQQAVAWAAGARAGTTLTVTTDPASGAQFGHDVALRATVTQAGGGTVTPTGSVIFTVDGDDRSPATLDSSGVATRTENFTIGTHTIAARYVDDANYFGSAGTLAGG